MKNLLIGFIVILLTSCGSNGAEVEVDNVNEEQEIEQLDSIADELDAIKSESDSLNQLLNEIEEL